MFIKRRQVLRRAGQWLAASAGSTVLTAHAPGWAADSKTPADEEEKKKSTLVSDIEEFGRGSLRIALLLPAIEGSFRFAADAVLRGFQAAHGVDGRGVYVKVFRLEEDGFADAPKLYEQLRRSRFNFAVGPLVRTSVNALGAVPELAVPTLMLNLPDQNTPIPANSVLFSLAIEYEGRSAARYAYSEVYQRVGPGRPLRALAISDRQALSQRSTTAFVEAWQSYGGEVEPSIIRDIRGVDEMRQLLVGVRADTVFAAISPELMREIRPAFSAMLPIYGTSRMNHGASSGMDNANLVAAPELNSIRVIDMPWQLMPEHPAVAAYPRSRRLPHVEMQRLYAFGIDAYRCARLLIEGNERFDLDGVTGHLSLDTRLDPRVVREPMLGEYREGILVPAFAPVAAPAAPAMPPATAPAMPPARAPRR